MPIFPSARCSLPALGLLALAFPAVGSAAPAAAPVAAAAPTPATTYANPNAYEQISRAESPRDATALSSLTTPVPVFASDLGLTAAWSQGPTLLNLKPVRGTTGVRNTLTNRTTELGQGIGRLVQVDKTEQTGLFREDTGVVDNQVQSAYRVGRLDGRGPFRTLDIPGENGNARVVLSGNGRFVVTASTQGLLRRLDLTTGRWTTIEQYAEIGPGSVSDDGGSIVGLQIDIEAQQINLVVWRNGAAKVLVPGVRYQGSGFAPRLSPDGSTAFSTDPPFYGGDESVPPTPAKVVAYDVATGTSRVAAFPFANWDQDTKPIWVSPSGDRIAYALGSQSATNGPLQSARVLDVKTGVWSDFGGVFGTSLTAGVYPDRTPTAISRNGTFAALAYNGQVALVNLAGRPLLGNLFGTDALSPTSYLGTTGLDYCGFGSSSIFSAGFVTPAPWIKPARRGHITVGDGTRTLADAEWTAPTTYVGTGGVVDGSGVSVRFPVAETHTRTVALRVTDGYGRTSSEKLSATLRCAAPTG